MSSLMDDENTSQIENKNIEEPADTPAQWEAPTVLQTETPLQARLVSPCWGREMPSDLQKFHQAPMIIWF